MPLVQSIPVAKILPSPYQARREFDPTALKELAQSMKDHGLTNAIHVRPIDGKFELIAGERRWRAAQLLKWKTIEAKVEEVTDQEAALRGMIENVQREDLSAIEQAIGYGRLSEPPFNLNQTQIAQRVEKDRTLINKYLSVAKLRDKQGGVNAFTPLGLEKLLELARLPKLADQLRLAKKVASDDLSTRELRAKVDRKLNVAGGKKSPSKTFGATQPAEDDPLRDVWASLMPDRGLSNSCKWEVSYPAEETWTFTVKPNGGQYLGFLWPWFLAMGQALHKRSGDSVSIDLKAPTLTQSEGTKERHVLLKWSEVKGAERYELLYGPAADKLKVMVTSGPIYGSHFDIDATAYKQKALYVAVRAVSEYGSSPLSSIRKISFL